MGAIPSVERRRWSVRGSREAIGKGNVMSGNAQNEGDMRPVPQNGVDAEAVSKRTAWTVRGIMLGSGVLVVFFGCWSVSAISWTAPEEAVPMALRWYLASLITVLGIAALGGVLTKMDRGIRQQNLRAIGIILVAVLVTLLVIASDTGIEAVLGLLGAIVGYLFGKDTSSDEGNPSGGGQVQDVASS